jgi:ABC-type glycerol-3-phosphate transport system substrate-binding protein
MQTVIKDFETANPGVSINTKQSHQDYRLRLKTALAQGGNGPDIFRYHSSWVPMMSQSCLHCLLL